MAGPSSPGRVEPKTIKKESGLNTRELRVSDPLGRVSNLILPVTRIFSSDTPSSYNRSASF